MENTKYIKRTIVEMDTYKKVPIKVTYTIVYNEEGTIIQSSIDSIRIKSPDGSYTT